MLAIAAAGVGLALLSRRDPGYVLITWAHWRLEIRSLVAALLALGAAFWVAHVLALGLRGARALPGRLRARRSRRALNALEQGVQALSAGAYAGAEKRLLSQVASSPVPLLHYLGAIWAAHRRGAPARRDELFEAARRALRDGEPALTYLQARCLLEGGLAPAAEELLDGLRGRAERSPAGLALLRAAREGSGSHWGLLTLLPRLRRSGVIDAPAAQRLERECHAALLDASPDPDGHWRRVPRRLRDQPELISAYVHALDRAGRTGPALEILAAALERRTDPGLMELYGTLEGADPASQLARAETWLVRHPRDPVLLLSLGRLARRAGQWNRARSFLETSVTLAPRPDARRLLGELLLDLGQTDAALTQFRAGLRAAVDGAPAALTAGPAGPDHPAPEAASRSAPVWTTSR